MGNRIAALYFTLVLCFMVLLLRLYILTQSNDLTAAAANQSTYTVEVTATRGQIYDCHMQPFTDRESSSISVIAPTPEAMKAVAAQVKGSQRAQLLEQMKNQTPFLYSLGGQKLYCKDIENFDITARWEQQALAPHVLGYQNGQGRGVSGIEGAYDELLHHAGQQVRVRYTVDGRQMPLPHSAPEVLGSCQPPGEGVVLTLDRRIQQVAQQAAEENISAGAVVVMEVKTGKLRAVASVPGFSQNNVAAVLQRKDAPLFNRAFGAYNVGSTFKLAVAAAALELGISPGFQAECLGGMLVKDRMVYCHNRGGHGPIEMKEAVAWSCNPYFIQLGQAVGAENIVYMAQAMGFGQETEFAPGMTSAKGYLPNAKEVDTPMALANLSFGQGSLLATPVQIAAMVSSIANGGWAVTPSLVEGITEDGSTFSQKEIPCVPNRILSSGTAAILREFMEEVVENGSGTGGKPIQGGAGGKTASAQTGQKDAGGNEEVHAWFAGYFPAEEPKYAAVVLVEGGEYGGKVASPIFKKIADGINAMEQKNGQ